MNAIKLCFVGLLLLATLTSQTTAKDTDGDGLADDLERQIGTSITSKDTDKDGGTDYDEVRLECNPLNPKQKIVKLGEWKKGYWGNSREAEISYNGNIVKKTDTMISGPIQFRRYFTTLKIWQEEKQMNLMLMDTAKKLTEEREKRAEERERYLALSPKYEQIKRMRLEHSKLREIYFANKTKENLEALNKFRISFSKLEQKEYEDAKMRVMAAGYSSRNRLEELEDKIEELEDKVRELE